MVKKGPALTVDQWLASVPAERKDAIHPVRDFDEFYGEFEANRSRHPEFGVLGTTVHRSVDNPNEVMVTYEMQSAKHAIALFTSDVAMRAWMDRAGLEIYPAVFVGRVVDAPA